MCTTDFLPRYFKNLTDARESIKQANLDRVYHDYVHPKQKLNEFLGHLFPVENEGIEISEKSHVLKGFTPRLLFDFGSHVQRHDYVDDALNTFFMNFENEQKAQKSFENFKRDLVICSYNWSRHLVCQFTFFFFSIIQNLTITSDFGLFQRNLSQKIACFHKKH